jgi:hypothetical protein
MTDLFLPKKKYLIVVGIETEAQTFADIPYTKILQEIAERAGVVIHFRGLEELSQDAG